MSRALGVMATVFACPGVTPPARANLCNQDQPAVKSPICGTTPKTNRVPVGSW